MVDFHELHKKIHKNLPDNNRQEISARDLREVLDDMTNVTEQSFNDITISVDKIVPGEDGQVLATYDGEVVWKDAPGGSIEVGDIKNDIKDIKSDINGLQNELNDKLDKQEFDDEVYEIKNDIKDIKNDLNDKLDKPDVDGEAGQVLTKTETGVEWKDLGEIDTDITGIQNEFNKRIGQVEYNLASETTRAELKENEIDYRLTQMGNTFDGRLAPIEEKVMLGEGGKPGQVWTRGINGGEWVDQLSGGQGGDADLYYMIKGVQNDLQLFETEIYEFVEGQDLLLRVDIDDLYDKYIPGVQKEMYEKIQDVNENIETYKDANNTAVNNIRLSILNIQDTIRDIPDTINEVKNPLIEGVGGTSGQVWTNTGNGGEWRDVEGGSGDVDLSGVQNDIKGVQNELRGVQNELTGIQNELNQKIQDVDVKIEGEISRATQKENEIEGRFNPIEILTTGVGASNGQVLTKTETGVEWKDVDVEDVDLTGIQNDITGVQNELRGVQEDIKGVQNDLTGVQNEMYKKIKEEDDRASEAERVLDGKVEGEKVRAESAEGVLDGKIEREIERATQKENEIEGKITSFGNTFDGRLTPIEQKVMLGLGASEGQVYTYTSDGPKWADVEGGTDLPLERGEGENSIIMDTPSGYENKVSGNRSVAFGNKNNISSVDSIVVGFNNRMSSTVSTGYSAIVGRNNESKGEYAYTFGEDNTSESTWGNTFIAGNNNKINSRYSVVLGNNNTVTKIGLFNYIDDSFIFGEKLSVVNSYEFALGIRNYPHKVTGDDLGTGTFLSVGLGDETSQTNSNVIEIMKNSDIYIKGVGGYDGQDFDSAKTLQEVVSEIKTYTGNYIQEIKQEGGSISFKSTNFRTGGTDDNTINFKTINGQSPFGMGDIVLYKVMTEDEFSKIQPQEGVFYYIEEN